MKFDVEIEMGNEAVQTRDDVADLLERLSSSIRIQSRQAGHETGGKILDANGNSVGRYGFDMFEYHGTDLRMHAVNDAAAHLDGKLIHETREKTDLEHAFDVAAYEAARAVVNGSPDEARIYAETCAAIGHAINGPKIDHLDLQDGDTLIVQCQRHVPPAQLVGLENRIRTAVGKDVRVLIFDHGTALAGVAFADRPDVGRQA